jgi:hypothetical protein
MLGIYRNRINTFRQRLVDTSMHCVGMVNHAARLPILADGGIDDYQTICLGFTEGNATAILRVGAGCRTKV